MRVLLLPLLRRYRAILPRVNLEVTLILLLRLLLLHLLLLLPCRLLLLLLLHLEKVHLLVFRRGREPWR